MHVIIPKEIHTGERRVAATPQTVLRLRKLGFDVAIQQGAGADTNFTDAAYKEAGANIVSDVRALWSQGNIVLKVRPPEQNTALAAHEADLLPESALLISFVWPAGNRALLDRLCARKITTLAMDCVPRISRAQKMDALSAMANIAGYRAVIEAANNFPRFFGGQITAAGKVDPAKVLVIGAGVAGLAAIGAARSLGAIVHAFDPRAATRDQVRSMGAEFLELEFKEEGEGTGGYAREMSNAFVQAEMALFAAQAMKVDIIITTALIPGKPAPKLITAGMVESMKPGSVIVDLAAEQGGNCALTKPGEVTVHKGVTIIGFTDLPGRMANLASQLYSSTVTSVLEEVCKNGTPSPPTPLLQGEKGESKPASPVGDGKGAGAEAKSACHVQINQDDQVIRGALVTYEGRITWPPPVPPTPPPPPEPGVAAKPPQIEQSGEFEKIEHAIADHKASIWLGVAALLMIGIGWVAPPAFLGHFSIFVLACFVGWQVIWNVKPALHTPLMSVTNAISGIILIGGMLHLSGSSASATLLGAVAVLIAAINISGGFLITQRMLAMFRRHNNH
jgi:NAD(P) transhydrogenase subunit alpha